MMCRLKPNLFNTKDDSKKKLYICIFLNKRQRIKWNEYCCCFLPSSFLKTSQLPLISAVCEAPQPASSDYNSQIDFLPWRFYQQHRNADFVLQYNQCLHNSNLFSYRGFSCLFEQLAIMKMYFSDTESLHMQTLRNVFNHTLQYILYFIDCLLGDATEMNSHTLL